LATKSSKADVRFGIISTANIATKVCLGMHAARGATPSAVASRDAGKAKSWAKKHRIPRSFGSYQALLEDPDIDAVYIALPPSMHHEWTIKAAEHGKHVLCEKPIALDLKQAKEMVHACKQHSVQLMDGVFWVHHPRANHLRKSLDKELIGRVRRVTSSFTFTFDWDETPVSNIRLKPDLGGGSLGDLGWYCIRITHFAFGDLPERVFATARYHNKVDINLSAMLWYSNERMASFDCGFDTVMRQWFEIAGTKSSLVCDDFVLPNSTETARYFMHDGSGKKRKEFTIADGIQEVSMVEDFARIVQSGKLDPRWPAETLATQTVVDALARSAKQGKIIELK
jgi:predicted dehydrogenase